MDGAEIGFVVQLTIGTVFAMSGAAKLRHPIAFARGAIDYRVLPPAASFIAGLTLIPLEVFLAFSHVTGQFAQPAVLVGLVTLVIFAVVIGLTLSRGRSVPCRCFGEKSEILSIRSLLRVLLLMLGELFLLRRDKLINVWDSALTAQIVGFAIIWVVAVLITAMWIFSMPDLIILWKGRSCTECRASTTPAEQMP